jgi:hypothetical protein
VVKHSQWRVMKGSLIQSKHLMKTVLVLFREESWNCLNRLSKSKWKKKSLKTN